MTRMIPMGEAHIVRSDIILSQENHHGNSLKDGERTRERKLAKR